MNIFSIFPEFCLSPVLLIQILVSFFLAILFLQSSIDKFVDWKGNLTWLKEHFATSLLGSFVPFMLGTVSIFELTAGSCCLMGAFELILAGTGTFFVYGLLFSALSLLCLFFGQRMAKDYAGAAILVPYFILVLIGLFSLVIT